MHITAKVNKVCSSKVDFDLIDGKVYNVVFTGGCNGNLKGICSLVKGQRAETVVEKLQGITCGSKPTSCPDQLARALTQAMSQQ